MENFGVYDPYLYSGKFNILGREGKGRLEGTTYWIKVQTFKDNANAQAFFAFKADGVNYDPILTPDGETKQGYINTSSLPLNVRSGPGTNYGVIGSLPKGANVTIYDERNGFSKIGDGKWVSSEYVAYGNNAEAPEPSPTPADTVGQTKKLAEVTSLFQYSNLTGEVYTYKAGTTVQILANISPSVDRIYVPATNRYAYVRTSAYVGGAPVPTSPEPAPDAVIMTVTAKSGLNVRSAPNSNASIVTAYAYGTKVQVYSISNGWAKGNKGYMSTQYLK